MSRSHTVPSRMKQVSFSDAEFAAKKKVTRRERFLSDLDRLVPWQALAAVIEPHYPKSGERGRPPIGLERMLRMYVAQNALGLSDEGIEDAIYDSGSVRRFVGVDLAAESAPDATTLLKFWRLLEAHGLTQRLFDAINAGCLSVNPVNLMFDGEYVRVSTVKSRQKCKNPVADPRIAISIPHRNNPNRYVEIRGIVELTDDVDRSFINSIARYYMNVDEYPFDKPGDERVTITIHAEQISSPDIPLAAASPGAPDRAC